MKKMGLIFFNIDRVKDETGLNKIKKIVGLKTNEEMNVLSKFEKEIVGNSYTKSIYDMFSCFEEWVENPYENKFVTFEHDDMKDLIEECKNVHFKSKSRDFYKIMSYQYWNIQNEIAYRMGIKKEKVSLEDLLSIYGTSFVGNQSVAKDLCFNTHILCTYFKLDIKRNEEVFRKPNHPSSPNIEAQEQIPVLDFQPIRANGEERLRQKMNEGWNISIECKAKGRGYGMTYEASAYPVDALATDRFVRMKHGVGKTLEELMDNLFEDKIKE